MNSSPQHCVNNTALNNTEIEWEAKKRLYEKLITKLNENYVQWDGFDSKTILETCKFDTDKHLSINNNKIIINASGSELLRSIFHEYYTILRNRAAILAGELDKRPLNLEKFEALNNRKDSLKSLHFENDINYIKPLISSAYGIVEQEVPKFDIPEINIDETMPWYTPAIIDDPRKAHTQEAYGCSDQKKVTRTIKLLKNIIASILDKLDRSR